MQEETRISSPVQVATEKMRCTEMYTARTIIMSLAVECRSISSEGGNQTIVIIISIFNSYIY
jgi:hypothetical protein